MSSKPDFISIAIVESHTMLRKALGAVLNSFKGCEVIISTDGINKMAGELEKGNLPDIVIINSMLEQVNGFRLIRHIRQQHPDIDILLLAPDYFSREVPVLHFFRRRIKGLLTSFATPHQFESAVRTICHRGYYYAPFIEDAEVANEYYPILNTYLPAELSPGELKLLNLVITDARDTTIALAMGLEDAYLPVFRNNLFEKLGIRNRIEAVIYAINNGIEVPAE